MREAFALIGTGQVGERYVARKKHVRIEII
jgi:hypothetical protein